ncbi:MAG: methyltransferase domain-containing protein, partial [Candidatus Brocadiales bacterium]
MRKKLLDILVCPSCWNPFTVKVFESGGEEIVEGLLLCRCGNVYPIINTIPRILQHGINDLEEFKKKYHETLKKEGVSWSSSAWPTDSFEARQERTQKSFGYQWTTFKSMDEIFREHTLAYLHPLTPRFFNGKFGLDAGCGMGRHMYYLTEFGAEMVGVDFSAAIDSALLNLKGRPRVHLVQADIYHLPFKEGTFDFVYSI